MASKAGYYRKQLAKRRAQIKGARHGAFRTIHFRLERGDISVEDAFNEVQEADRAQRSRLDRFLEAIVG